MFGEMVGAALADCWTRAGAPADAIYVELGPGRGTLASDALRVMRAAGLRWRSAFHRDQPGAARASSGSRTRTPSGTTASRACPEAAAAAGRQRIFRCAAGAAVHRRDRAPGRARRPRAWRSTATARSSRIRRRATKLRGEIGALLDERGGVALVIDYGHASSAPGETLQAVRGHAFAPLLHKPGEQDLTAHVDFEALASAGRGRRASKVTPLVTQGEWLEAARASALAPPRWPTPAPSAPPSSLPRSSA